MALALEVAITREENSETYLETLQNLIAKFLLIYRAIVSPIRECFSRSGLRISKFHGLLHIVFYIRQYGCTFNFFGGFCESHLKSLVKQRAKNMSRQQDHLDLDIMNRQYKEGMCEAAMKELDSIKWFGTTMDVDEEDEVNEDTDDTVGDEPREYNNLRPQSVKFTAFRKLLENGRTA